MNTNLELDVKEVPVPNLADSINKYEISNIPSLVQYQNKMNDMGFNGMTVREMRLFMTVIAGMCEKGSGVQHFSFTDLKKIMNEDDNRNWNDLETLIQSTSQRLLGTYIFNEDGNQWEMFNLFQRFHGNVVEGILTVETNPYFFRFLNQLKESKGYTQFEIEEFNSIKGKYSQILYRKIVQYRNMDSKQCYLCLTDLKRIFEIKDTDSQCSSTKYINNRILFPAIREINKIKAFRHLRIDKEKMKGQRPIYKYFFRWDKPKKEEL